MYFVCKNCLEHRMVWSLNRNMLRLDQRDRKLCTMSFIPSVNMHGFVYVLSMYYLWFVNASFVLVCYRFVILQSSSRILQKCICIVNDKKL